MNTFTCLFGVTKNVWMEVRLGSNPFAHWPVQSRRKSNKYSLKNSQVKLFTSEKHGVEYEQSGPGVKFVGINKVRHNAHRDTVDDSVNDRRGLVKMLWVELDIFCMRFVV